MVDFDVEAREWLLGSGQTKIQKGYFLGGDYFDARTVITATYDHLKLCGINHAESLPVMAGAIPNFQSTFEDFANEPAIVAEVICNCGSTVMRLISEELRLAEVFKAVSAWSSSQG